MLFKVNITDIALQLLTYILSASSRGRNRSNPGIAVFLMEHDLDGDILPSGFTSAICYQEASIHFSFRIIHYR